MADDKNTTDTTDSGKTTEGGKPEESKLLPQSEVDRIVAERLARERAKYADYDDVKKKAAEFDELTEKQKSEAQKAIERAERAEEKAAEAEKGRLRAEIATAKGLTATQAARLVGSTKEELEADADAFLADLKASNKAGDFGGGERGSDVGGGVKQWTRADLAGKTNAEINEARRKGHLDKLRGKTS